MKTIKIMMLLTAVALLPSSFATGQQITKKMANDSGYGVGEGGVNGALGIPTTERDDFRATQMPKRTDRLPSSKTSTTNTTTTTRTSE
jgi:hypothetical protein